MRKSREDIRNIAIIAHVDHGHSLTNCLNRAEHSVRIRSYRTELWTPEILKEKEE